MRQKNNEQIKKINLLLKYSGKIIFAINLVLVIGISFPACFVIHLKGVQFEAFEESSPYYLFYPVINLKIFF